tara:strand:+ start:3229 stop:6585 length:3357 start_codon:yes stop_codon:yes gene_type:complete
MTNSYQFGNSPVYVSEGQTVRFRFKAPSAWDSTTSVNVLIGLQNTVWYISTVPADFAPNPFPFTTLDDADPDTLYTYGDGNRVGETIVTVSGLTDDTEVGVALTSSHTNPTASEVSVRRKRPRLGGQVPGEMLWSAWSIPSGWLVQNTDQLQLRLKSNPNGGLSYYADLRVGTRTEKWTINTKVPPPNYPNPEPDYGILEDQPLDTDVYSNRVLIQGMSDFGIVSTDNGAKIGISTTGAYSTNDDGFSVLSGVTFVDSSTNPTITNGQWIQLMVTTSPTANTAITNQVTIGSGAGNLPVPWRVETGDLPSETPANFIFSNKINQIEDFLIESDQQPPSGITDLGTDVSVDVILLDTTGSEPGVRIQHDGAWSSWGIFPASVVLGDKIQIRNKSSATFSGVVSTTIKVGTREIIPWTITTNTGPDTDASFTPPQSLTNTAPNTPVVSSIVPILQGSINRPITINATNYAKISVDFGAFVAGPVTFDPTQNSSFQLQLTTAGGLSGQTTTTVTVGTGSTNNPFTWGATNYAVVPPPPELKGAWYSKKTAFVDMSGGGQGVIRQSKEDGYAIGTVLPILKDPTDASDQDPMKQYGELKGSTVKGRLDAKYPGYLDCDGSEYNVADFPDLWWVIKNNYAKTGDDTSTFGAWDNTTKVYSGKFRVPDYRNRRMVGPGQVDGNKGSSTILPIDTGIHPSKTFNAREAGGIGGYWYVDDVDVTAGDPNPYQQIVGDEGGSSGISSDFFNFGTVRTITNEDIVVDIEFEIVGDVTATVGPLSDVQVNVPAHSHFYVAAVSDAFGGEPLIAWNQKALFGYTPYKFENNESSVNQWIGDTLGRHAYPTELPYPWDIGQVYNNLYYNDPDSTEDIGDSSQEYKEEQRDKWLQYLGAAMPNFETEWDKIFSTSIDTLEQIVDDMIAPIDENNNRFVGATLKANTWWVNPGDSVKDEYFTNLDSNNLTAVYSQQTAAQGLLTGTAGTTTENSVNQSFPYSVWNAKVVACIDTESSTFRISPYEPPVMLEDTTSTVEKHSHYLSDFPLTDPTTDYGYGNIGGAGHKQGLGTAAATTRPVTFTQSDVNIELNTGTFTLNKGTKLPAPNVAFHPNRKVELVNKFHKVKYIIKAF